MAKNKFPKKILGEQPTGSTVYSGAEGAVYQTGKCNYCCANFFFFLSCKNFKFVGLWVHVDDKFLKK